MDLTDKPIMFLLVITVIVILIMGGAFLVIKWVDYSFINNIPTTVIYKGDIIFQGKNACIDVDSSGDATNVKISSGLFCLFPKEVYTDKGDTFKIIGTK